MRFACIDIGTNTTRLLVAEPGPDGGLRVIAQQRAFATLGDRTEIGPEGLAALTAAVLGQAARMRELEAERARVVATGALRSAADRDAVLAALGEAAGLEVEVLSGEEEAALAFDGALAAMDPAPAGTVAVVDVGGGSTELAFGTALQGARWTASMAVGSGALTDALLAGDPPTGAELDRARAEAAAAWEALGELPRAALALAVGGSAASLPRIAGERIDPAAVAEAVERVTAGPAHEVAERHGIDPLRVRLLPAGLVILEAGARRLGLPLEVGRGGLREGVVRALMAGG
jgi:exopolyphosphatase / guanosine-5'-triphosphate,3'-diphosphate pyrophosphatase